MPSEFSQGGARHVPIAGVRGLTLEQDGVAYVGPATQRRRHDDAARLLAGLLAAPRHHYRPPVPVAKAYVALGDVDAAFRWLERGFD